MRKKNELKLSEAIQLMLSDLNLSQQFLATEAQEFWYTELGNSIAAYTEKVWVKKRVMVVKLSSPELRNELQYGKQKIINQINTKMGQEYLLDLRLI